METLLYVTIFNPIKP